MKKKQVRMLVSLTVSGDWPGDPLMLRLHPVHFSKMLKTLLKGQI